MDMCESASVHLYLLFTQQAIHPAFLPILWVELLFSRFEVWNTPRHAYNNVSVSNCLEGIERCRVRELEFGTVFILMALFEVQRVYQCCAVLEHTVMYGIVLFCS